MSNHNIVVFDLWGQRCFTVFNKNSELDLLKWLDTVEEKGWIYPVEVRRQDDTVLYSEEELKQILYR